MFNTKQTRLTLFLTVVITILLCIIGLNWEEEEEEETAEVNAVLESPMLEGSREPAMEIEEKKEPVEPEQEEEDTEVDEGETIILE
ncbi:MAG: hypothetical protein ACQEQC_02875 [Elusimicrobiota bacterium]